MRLFSCIFLLMTINKSFASNVIIKPSVFTIHSSNGKDWMYQEKAINAFGFGIRSFIENKNWKLTFDYLQIGLLGNVTQDIYNFSPQQSYAYIDQSKDAEGFWTEYINTKLSCQTLHLLKSFCLSLCTYILPSYLNESPCSTD